jgi:RNA 2',3'-cyclic 3'-phosphodiesterase
MANNIQRKRFFIAADIKEDIKSVIYKYSLENLSSFNNIRLIPPENLHITFKFIGSMEINKIEIVKKTIKRSISSFRCFKYSMEEKISAFPSIRKARVLIIGIKEGAYKLIEMYNAIESNLKEVNIPEDRRDFSPHITVARVKKPLNIESTEVPDLPIFKGFAECTSISLYESILQRNGAKYINIERFDLK